MKKKKIPKDEDQVAGQASEKDSRAAGISSDDRQALIQKLEGASMFSHRSNSISELRLTEKDN